MPSVLVEHIRGTLMLRGQKLREVLKTECLQRPGTLRDMRRPPGRASRTVG
ncbi:hypothetical protein K438DRAFT_1878920 [Mycena galopus ATCC 62051]|nr:hypothetical protein K438DRAFT_1878920 [Mycena galopus ATCC 62051]